MPKRIQLGMTEGAAIHPSVAQGLSLEPFFVNFRDPGRFLRSGSDFRDPDHFLATRDGFLRHGTFFATRHVFVQSGTFFRDPDEFSATRHVFVQCKRHGT